MRNREYLLIHFSLITDSCKKIIETIHQTQAISVGPIPLPTRRKRYCVLVRIVFMYNIKASNIRLNQ